MNIRELLKDAQLTEGANELLHEGKNFLRLMQGRLKADAEYYLGYGNRAAKHLWTPNEREFILLMWLTRKKLGWFNSYLSKREIKEYAREFFREPIRVKARKLENKIFEGKFLIAAADMEKLNNLTDKGVKPIERYLKTNSLNGYVFRNEQKEELEQAHKIKIIFA